MKKSRFEIDSTQGFYYFRKHNGIRYDVIEGVTIGKNQRFSNDIVYIMLEAYEDLPCMFVNWTFGATDVEEHSEDSTTLKWFDELTDEWETKNPHVVNDILNGKHEEM